MAAPQVARAEASPEAVEKSFELPDGSTITVGADRFRWAEGLFDPELVGTKACGVGRQLFDSIMRCDTDVRSDLFKNVVLTGGLSQMPGLADRVKDELAKDAPRDTRVKVVAPNDQFGAWMGGSILASLQTFQPMYITRADYDATGPTVVNQKCAC